EGERRDLPASQVGRKLVAHHDLTPAFAGASSGACKECSKDGDRSNRGSGHPGEPSGAQTPRICSGPEPRNPSGPAVDPTAHTGRTHDRNRPDPSQLHKILARAGAVHTWVPAFAGTPTLIKL